MLKRALSLICIAVMMISMLSLTAAADVPIAVIGSNNYSSLQDAVNAIEEGATGLIELKKSTNEIVNVSCDVYVDLAGNNIAGVNVTAGTFYGMDSATIIEAGDDAKVSYGKIASTQGAVKAISVDDEYSVDSYLLVEETAGASFHAVNLRLSDMSLRAEAAGVYFKSDFAGDEKVAAQVKRFGVALSIDEIPSSQNIQANRAVSKFTGFKAGANNNATSTLLKGIMKDDNAFVTNKRNAEMPVYGRAYVELKDGTFIFGEAKSRSLKEQTEMAAKDTAKVNDQLIGMYKKFTQVMSAWNVVKVESAMLTDRENPVIQDKSSLKILAITSSFGMNTTELLYEVAKSYGYENVVVARLYGSGCPLERHVDNALNDLPFYMYTKKDDTGYRSEYDPIFPEGKKDEDGNFIVEGATLQYGLEDEQWDVIFVQQSASSAGYLPSYQNYVDQLMEYLYAHKPTADTKFVWNMTWAFQEGADMASFSRYFNNDQMFMYQSIVDVLQRKIAPRTDFDAIIPTGTAIQNARTSYFGDNLCIDWRNDLIHLNTLGRVIAAHTLFATLTGQSLEEIILTEIPKEATPETRALTLTKRDKLVILEAVNNALADPFHITQSIYTEAN